MNHGYIPGPDQPEGEVVTSPGQAIGGFAVGIVVINAWYPFFPGNVANASTFEFPVLFKIIKNASLEQIMCGDPALLPAIIEAGNELVGQGVRCIVGACGSFAYYQQEAAAALSVPVFLSSMLQVPLILASLQPSQRLGVITASPTALNDRVFEQCNITEPSRLAIIGAKDLSGFKGVMECNGRLDSALLERQLVDLAKSFVDENIDLGAILLQCSDLPPYAYAIQRAVNLPVFDMTTLIRWAYEAVIRKPFSGIV